MPSLNRRVKRGLRQPSIPKRTHEIMATEKKWMDQTGRAFHGSHASPPKSRSMEEKEKEEEEEEKFRTLGWARRGNATLGSIFLPSSSCGAEASTLSTEAASANVTNPNPLLLSGKTSHIHRIRRNRPWEQRPTTSTDDAIGRHDRSLSHVTNDLIKRHIKYNRAEAIRFVPGSTSGGIFHDHHFRHIAKFAEIFAQAFGTRLPTETADKHFPVN